MPENTVYVGRPSKWGNPFVGAPAIAVQSFERQLLRERAWCPIPVRRWPNGMIPDHFTHFDEIKAELRGKNLACWCKLSEPCHADVLLEWANE